MTQQQLVIEYLKQHDTILPAKIAGTIFMGSMFGSETSKRCRELRKKGILKSTNDGKFEVFSLVVKPQYQYFKVEGSDKIIKLLKA